MARLIDRLLVHGFDRRLIFPEYREGAKALQAEIAAAVQERAPIIDVHNVAHYLYAENDQEEWDIFKDFPNLAPPFPAFWMEYRRPARLLSREYGARRPDPDWPRAIGAFITADEVPDAAEVRRRATPDANNALAAHINHLIATVGEDRARQVAERLNAPDGQKNTGALFVGLTRDERELLVSMAEAVAVVRAESGKDVTAGCRWYITCRSVMEHPQGGMMPLGVVSFAVDGHGVPEPTSYVQGVYLPDAVQARLTMEECAGIKSMLAPKLFPMFLAISLMHCKNVKHVMNEPTEQERATHNRRHRRPLLRYYTLVIDPMREVLEHEGGARKTGLLRALHITRGHFAHYTEDRPLFGRIAGTFWRPSHLRGSRHAGEIIKDYRVKSGGPE